MAITLQSLKQPATRKLQLQVSALDSAGASQQKRPEDELGSSLSFVTIPKSDSPNTSFEFLTAPQDGGTLVWRS